MVKYENEHLETDIKPDFIKNVYCKILPAGYSQQSNSDVTEKVEHTHKFRIRISSIKEPKADMFFMHKGFRYDFISWDVDFKNSEFLEIFTKKVIE